MTTTLTETIHYDTQLLKEAYALARNPRLTELERHRIIRELETQHMEALTMLARAGAHMQDAAEVILEAAARLGGRSDT